MPTEDANLIVIQALGYSSHVVAVEETLGSVSGDDALDGPRPLAVAGEIQVRRSDASRPPNVLIVFLESVSHASTSFGRGVETTPFLRRFAADGVEVVRTMAVMPHTGKAVFAALTGRWPDLAHDSVESVPRREPLESLISMLRRAGYRDVMMQMSKGAFESAPAFYANLGFSDARFREDLADASAHLGYLGGDDNRVLDPLLTWIRSDARPFVAVLVTTVSHDPYDLPAWVPDRLPPDSPREARHARAVAFTDDFLSSLCERLSAAGVYDETLVCFIGDHGDGFRPESPRARTIPFEEVIRVPWVMRLPASMVAGTQIDVPASQVDVTPTLLSALGFEFDAARFDGRDLLAPDVAPRPVHFASWYKSSPRGLLDGDRKYLFWPLTGTLVAYDLADDPDEHNPRPVPDAEAQPVLGAIERWVTENRHGIEEGYFAERVLYDRWRVVGSGRNAWTYRIGDEAAAAGR